ncbi:MAG: hypothetical protein NTX50_02525 [Candidatus Sumerlaeota bacterium]|nr:hypothetical protein [Candidatus Sumerlaeota bacterium]
MDYKDFRLIIDHTDHPVVLLERTRDLPSEDRDHLVSLGARVARDCPSAFFRSGNARGSDEAFAEGVGTIDPTRLQFVLPYERHRKATISGASFSIALSEMPKSIEDEAACQAERTSPQYADMLAYRNTVPKLKSKSWYILRDTIKVIGAENTRLQPATIAIFYANPTDPMKGGTGHTIRVCRDHGVPVILQDEWMKWTAMD